MKIENIKKIASAIFVIISIILVYAMLSVYFSPKNKQDINEKTEENKKIRKGLEIGLVILVVILVILGLITGYMKLFEEEKKKYLTYEGQEMGEYKFRFKDEYYYVKKEDLKAKL